MGRDIRLGSISMSSNQKVVSNKSASLIKSKGFDVTILSLLSVAKKIQFSRGCFAVTW